MTVVAKLKLMRMLDDNSKILPVECLNERAASYAEAVFTHSEDRYGCHWQREGWGTS